MKVFSAIRRKEAVLTGLLLGLDIPAAGGLDDPAGAAADAEALGFDFISNNDHVLGRDPRYEGWTLLAWLTAATSRVRVVSRVLGVPYRNPALVAKMAESLDRLSGGRLVLGLGAGSGEAEYRAMGMPDASLAARVTDLADTIETLRGLWTGEPFSYSGRAFGLDDAQIAPRAEHPIPIWLGASGPRGLDLIGRAADGWIPSLPYVSPADAPGKIASIRRAAAQVGRDADALDLIYNVEVAFDANAAADLAGPPAQLADQLRGFLALGFSGFNFLVVGPDRSAGVDRLAREVVPLLRQG
jgi:alkanesulfonate monooxygenase SsuD/methylene tetrahydromethanopterin reductase-like flavin-dependent oxidoreductase (luciferase family)